MKIERMHYHAKSGVRGQQIQPSCYTTHTDAPAHVVEGARFSDEVLLASYFGMGFAVSIPKRQWELITAEDLEHAIPTIREGDIVIVNTAWHRHYGASRKYSSNPRAPTVRLPGVIRAAPCRRLPLTNMSRPLSFGT